MRPTSKGQPWGRKELILTLDLYKDLKGHIPDLRDPEIIALSSVLSELALMQGDAESSGGRSRAAIIFKMSNFRSLDPQARDKGKTGLANVGSLDRAIWNEFLRDPTKLRREAKSIRAEIRAGRKEIQPLRANLHILRLLGDELIGSPQLAIFELVKNAYDADAENAFVHMDLDGQAPSITVRDNGSGMSIETIREGWLQIGTPLKRGSQIERTTRFGRLPLGEKGVGRLAAFKLGNRLEMFTRQAGGTEYQIVMDLENIFAADDKMRDSSLEDVRVWVRAMREPKHFSGNKSGTLIRINKLRPELDWPRREIRELRRMVNSLSSPFKEIGEFKAVLEVPGRQDEITDLMEIDSILDRAVWSYRFKLSAKSLFEWEYRFNPPDVLRGLKTRELRSAEAERLEYEPYEPDDDMPSRPPRDRLFAPPEDFKGIGPMEGRIYVYDLRSEVLKHLGGTKLVKMVLQNQGGIRVYRDGVRVFNYGEPGDDWLELNIKRVNKPGRTLATNSVLSAIHLTMDQSQGLREKTNREGFDENEAYNRFRKIVQSVIEHFNTKRQPDREALDSILKGDPIREGGPERLRKSVDEILEIARKKGIIDQISKPIERVRKEYETLQEVVVSSGAGLNIAIVFHEVER
ncbi:MAG: ATP-binding protein, partial [Deltaproteobacteria bacterium]|nr:ATP-binding protein [Deltaproteobacteria bacterium]